MNKAAEASYRRLGVFVQAVSKYGKDGGNLDYLCKKEACLFLRHMTGSDFRSIWFVFLEAIRSVQIRLEYRVRSIWWRFLRLTEEEIEDRILLPRKEWRKEYGPRKSSK